MNQPLLYDSSRVAQYPGLEFVSPIVNTSENGWRSHVLPFTALSSIPERWPGPDENKLRSNVQRAYFGVWGFTNGNYICDRGVDISNGYHRTALGRFDPKQQGANK